MGRAARETRAVSFPTESWVYVPFGLELFFSDQMNSGKFDYPLQSIELPADVSNFGVTNRLAQQFLNTPRKQAEELIKKVPESFKYDYGGEQLTFVYDMVSFKGADGRTEIEVAYSIPSYQLGNSDDGLGMQTWFSGRVALQDEKMNQVIDAEKFLFDIQGFLILRGAIDSNLVEALDHDESWADNLPVVTAQHFIKDTNIAPE